MSVAEAVLEKLRTLPLSKQEQALRYVESLAAKGEQGEANSKAQDVANSHPWIDVALSLKLEGPADWSEKFEKYLDGKQGGSRR
jgi:hypothetical protein